MLSKEMPPRSMSLERGYAYFQEFVPGNSYKTAITVIGDRAFGLAHYNGPNDFRSNGEKYDYDPKHIELTCVQKAFEISERLGFSMMSYDFLSHHGEPVVLEMALHYSGIGIHPGDWKQNLEWVSSKPTAPHEAQVDSFLNEMHFRKQKESVSPNRFQPEIASPKFVKDEESSEMGFGSLSR